MFRFLFPDGRAKVVTLSYDDGVTQDRRLIGMMNEYGFKGSFFLNSGLLGDGRHVAPEEIATLYAGHEIGVHSVHHPFLDRVDALSALREVLDDRAALEKISGRLVYGMSYPMGTCNQTVVDACRAAGIAYSRTVVSTGRFDIPEDFLRWPATCHHSMDLDELGKRFVSMPYSYSLLYVWGHSYEFDREVPGNNWKHIENFMKIVGNQPSIWYATGIEIYEYVQALSRLRVGAALRMVYNPSAIAVWLECEGKILRVGPGETVEV